MRERLRVIQMPSLEERDPMLLETIETDEFKKALLARIVTEAAGFRPGQVPDDPESEEVALQQLVIEDVGLIGELASRIVPSDGEFLLVNDVIEEYQNLNGGTLGKYTPQTFGRAIGNAKPDLPKSVSRKMTVNGERKSVKVWVGWRLEDVEDENGIRVGF